MSVFALSSISALDRPAVMEARTQLNEIETLYLQVSFDDVASQCAVKEDGIRTCREKPQLTVIDSLRTRVEQSLQAIADHLLNSYSPDVSQVVFFVFFLFILFRCGGMNIHKYSFHLAHIPVQKETKFFFP